MKRPGPELAGALRTRAGWMRIGGATALLIALAALNNLFGYARDIVLAAWYGASAASDAFFVGSFVPLLVNQVVVVGALTPAFLPVLTQTGAPGAPGDPARARLTWAMAGVAALVGGVGAALLWGAAPALVGAVAPGLSPLAAGQAAGVLRLSAPSILFLAPMGALSAALNYHARFVAPALAAVAGNACVVGALALSGPAHGLEAGALGMTAGAGAGLVIVGLALSRVWPRGPRSAVGATASGLRRTGALAAPLLLGVAVTQIVAVVERYLASQLAPGSLSLLQYAMKLNLLPSVILAGTMTTVLYPTLSRRVGSAEFSAALAHGLAQVLVWTAPAAAGLIVAAEPIMRLLYQRGQFGPADAAEAALLLTLYAGGLPAWSLAQMLPRAYHARQDMTRPLLCQVLAVAGYLALAPPLTLLWGARGVAGAFALYSYLTLGIFLWGLRRDLAPVAGALGRVAAHTAFSAGALALVTFAALRVLPVPAGGGLAAQAALLGLAGVAGLSAYIGCMTALHSAAGPWRRGRPTAPVTDPGELLDEAGG